MITIYYINIKSLIHINDQSITKVKMLRKQTFNGNSKRKQLVQLQLSRQTGHAIIKSSSFIWGYLYSKGKWNFGQSRKQNHNVLPQHNKQSLLNDSTKFSDSTLITLIQNTNFLNFKVTTRTYIFTRQILTQLKKLAETGAKTTISSLPIATFVTHYNLRNQIPKHKHLNTV